VRQKKKIEQEQETSRRRCRLNNVFFFWNRSRSLAPDNPDSPQNTRSLIPIAANAIVFQKYRELEHRVG